MHTDPPKQWKRRKCLKYEDIGALLTSSPPSHPKALTPPQHFSPLTNPRVGCRVRVHWLGFPLSDTASITRAKTVLTAAQACTHTHTSKNVTHRATPALGKCPLGFELFSGGQNSWVKRDPSQVFTCVISSRAHLYPIKFSHYPETTSVFQLKVKGISMFPGAGKRDDTDTQSFLHFSLSLFFFFLPPLSVCRSRRVGCLSA